MRRRDFIALLGGATVLPIAASAQQPDVRARALLSRILQLQADGAASKIGQFFNEIVSQLGWTTQLSWSVGTMEQRRFDVLRLLRQVPAVTELSLLDGSGIEQLKVSRLAMDVVATKADLSQEPKFSSAMAQKVYFGPFYFRRQSEPYITVALAGTRREYGVTVAEVALKLVWDVATQIHVGNSGMGYVVDAQDRLIVHPDTALVLRSTDMSSFAQVQAARAAGDSPTHVQAARDIRGRDVLSVSASVGPALGWHVFAELPLAEADTAVDSWLAGSP
jgi:hypothetical protein